MLNSFTINQIDLELKLTQTFFFVFYEVKVKYQIRDQYRPITIWIDKITSLKHTIKRIIQYPPKQSFKNMECYQLLQKSNCVLLSIMCVQLLPKSQSTSAP